MNPIQLFARKQGSGEWVQLDLFAEDPIKLTLSVQDIQDPIAATSVFSRTFKVPNTSTNSKFFKAVFNVNSMDFDAAKKAEAYINDNGVLFSIGNIVLVSVLNTEKQDNIQYEINFYGETSDFGTKIGGFLNEVDLTSLNHSKTLSNIQNSWTNGLFNGDIVYGLIEWGYDYNSANQPTLPTLSDGFSKSFTVQANALGTEQWKPQIRAKALWDKIFEETGYTYDSDFLNSALFKKLYVIAENQARATLGTNNGVQAIDNGGTYLSTTIGAQKFIFDQELFDPGNNFVVGSWPNPGRYKIPTNGTYEFKIECFYSVISSTPPPSGIPVTGYFRAIDAATGNSIGTANVSFYASQNTLNPAAIITVNGIAGQEIYFDALIFSTGWGQQQVDIWSSTLSCITYPDVLSVQAILPGNIRKIDFMRSIINRFRLVFVPSKDIQNHFTITPWKDWILEGNSKDWTSKLNGQKDIVIKPLFADQNRLQVYKDQEDGDYLNYNYQLTYKQSYGQLNLDSNNELITGTKTYQDQFAPTPVAPIAWESNSVMENFVIPHIAKDSGATENSPGKREPIQPKLRLVFYNGMVANPTNPNTGNPYAWYQCEGTLVNGQCLGIKYTKTSYPLMSTYSAWPVTNSTYNLDWENEPPLWDPAYATSLGNGLSSFSNFNVYWKTWYDTTFDPYSRIVEASFVLDWSDLYDLKFNDYIFVKDAWYFINKVKDYVIGQKTECRVELVKVGNNIGITLPYVAPTQLVPVTLCKGNTACEAFCCHAPLSPSQFYMDGATLATSSQVYADSLGQVNIPSGIYSDGITTVQINQVGTITQTYNTSSCNCTQTAYQYTTSYANSGCNSCCAGNTVIVYSATNTWNASLQLFLDAALTIPATPGYYTWTGDTSYAFQVGNNGIVTQAFICNNCNCTTYYKHTVCYSATALCNSYCCSTGSQDVWTNSSTWNTSTQIYLNSVGSVTAPLGWYTKNNDIAVVNVTSGTISAWATGASCACGTGPISADLIAYKSLGGYSVSLQLYKSYDGTNWIAVDSITNDNPLINTTVVKTINLEEGIYLKTTISSTVPDGLLGAGMWQDTETTDDIRWAFLDPQIATPGTASIQTVTPITDNGLHWYIPAYVNGGTAPDENLYDLFISGNFSEYKNNPGYGGAISLDATTAAINTDFNIPSGFDYSSPYITHPVIEGLERTDTHIYFGGYFDSYKGVTIPKGVCRVDHNGVIDTEFQTNIGTALYDSDNEWAVCTDITVWDNKIYVAGYFNEWNGHTKFNLVRLNMDGTEDLSFTTGINSTVEDIQIYDNKIYIVGGFAYVGAYSRNRIARLNMDGSVDTSWNCAYSGSDTIYKLKVIPNRGIYITTRYALKAYNFDGSVMQSFIEPTITPSDRTPWDVVMGLETYPGGLYVYGSFKTINGTTYTNPTGVDPNLHFGLCGIAKLDYLGNVDINFKSGYAWSDDTLGNEPLIFDALAWKNSLYLVGSMNSVYYNYDGTNILAPGVIKLNRETGAYDGHFYVDPGFTDAGYSELSPRRIKGETNAPIYPLTVNYSQTDGCQAYCGLGTEVTIYANGQTLGTSTEIYSDSAGNTMLPLGLYSDGVVIANLQNYIGVIDFINPSDCSCTTLHSYTVNYSASECTACSESGNLTVYALESIWSTITILYADPQGTTFAAPGWYARYQNLALIIGLDGVAEGYGDCVNDCTGPTQYAAYRSGSFVKNDCPSGYYGSTVNYSNTYYSLISQADADFIADTNFPVDGQNYANTNGSCTVTPPSEFFAYRAGTFTKNDCPSGYVGSDVYYEHTYSSTISQEFVDDYANSHFPTDGQAFANTNGYCTYIPPVDCASYRILNIDSTDITASWVDCNDQFHYITIPSGEFTYTNCTQLSQINVTGEYKIGAPAWC